MTPSWLFPWRVDAFVQRAVNRSIASRIEKLESAPREPPDKQLRRDLDELSDRIEAIKEAGTEVLADLAGRTAADDATLRETLDALSEKYDDIVLAVSEGIERTDRSERRIQATIRSARRRLAEGGYSDPGIEAEVDQLRAENGESGDPEGVPPVREALALVDPESSSVKGVTVEQLRRARGM